ncbi:hypothetical protein BDN67DRAFT_976182, partial [Paxillus ammoniavirescens]
TWGVREETGCKSTLRSRNNACPTRIISLIKCTSLLHQKDPLWLWNEQVECATQFAMLGARLEMLGYHR